jgi:dTDP-4-dehydrorhamnose reductase/catechol 2,3-dioxygenase-like lactoylglutathione lyase family enzyme
MGSMAKVLVTGSAGAVGRAVCRELVGRGHHVRGLDRVPTPGLEDVVTADIAEAEGPVRAACKGVDAVVHLAAEPNDAPFPTLLGPNVVGVHNVLRGAREEGVKRVVLASTMQVVWPGPPLGHPARVDQARPPNHYGLTKLWAEQMGEMYARCYGMSVIAVRLVWMVRNAREARKMRAHNRPEIYVSNRDAGRAFANAALAEGITFEVVYVAGPDAADLFDLEPARRIICFEPRDRWPEGLAFDPDEAPGQPILGGCDMMAFVATRDRSRARAFYRDVLGLELVSEDDFALMFEAGSTKLRVSVVQDLPAASHTVLGWHVRDIAAAVKALVARGVTFERFPFFEQDPLGVWTAPGGGRVAWFKDPDGNTLSLTQPSG